MFLPPAARNQLLRTRAVAGEDIRITKLVNGRETSWTAEVLSDANVDYAPKLEQSIREMPKRTSPPVNGATALASQPSQARGNSHLAQALCLAIYSAI
jgi:hypothetical protein